MAVLMSWSRVASRGCLAKSQVAPEALQSSWAEISRWRKQLRSFPHRKHLPAGSSDVTLDSHSSCLALLPSSAASWKWAAALSWEVGLLRICMHYFNKSSEISHVQIFMSAYLFSRIHGGIPQGKIFQNQWFVLQHLWCSRAEFQLLQLSSNVSLDLRVFF